MVNEIFGRAISSRADHPLRWVVADVLEAMPPEHAEPLRMWAWENMTYAAIARELGLAGRSSGHARVKAALAAFKPRLEEALEAAARRPDSQ